MNPFLISAPTAFHPNRLPVSVTLGLMEWVSARPSERRGDERADDPGTCPGVEPEEGPGATFSRSFSAFSRSTSNCGRTDKAGQQGGTHLKAGSPFPATVCPSTNLHVVHGFPKLVQLVGGVEGLQADVCELHLLLPQLRAQLRDFLFLWLLFFIAVE